LGDRVRVEDRPAGLFGVITFRGRWKEITVREHESALRRVLADNSISVTGPALYARYDPPSVPGIFRRNEVLVPVSGEGQL
jgi:SOUL heme-binding protein.